jgi:hypothetical protein
MCEVLRIGEQGYASTETDILYLGAFRLATKLIVQPKAPKTDLIAEQPVFMMTLTHSHQRRLLLRRPVRSGSHVRPGGGGKFIPGRSHSGTTVSILST